MKSKLILAYHENGGNESFLISGGGYADHQERKRLPSGAQLHCLGFDSYNQNLCGCVAPSCRANEGDDNKPKVLMIYR